MLVQTGLIDVTHWQSDAEFGIFPQGARAKEAYFSPERPGDSVITPNKRYLFKRSKKSYPDQFWAEVIAYRIGCLMGLEVPPAFVAWNQDSGHCAALIEWFYRDGEERCILAGDYLTRAFAGYDREKGSTHNLTQIATMMRAFTLTKLLDTATWQLWWARALLFDAVIGNTDRHQDNWAFLYRPAKAQQPGRWRLSPLFDNGTSLGHERFPERIRNWNDQDFARVLVTRRTTATQTTRWLASTRVTRMARDTHGVTSACA